jgi:GTP pyrophosphokinase
MVTAKPQSSSENAIQWLDDLSRTFNADELKIIRDAVELASSLYADQFELTGAPLLQHALGAGEILAQMGMDHESIAAAVLHAAPIYQEDWPRLLKKNFSENVRSLVDGLSHMEQIRQFSESHTSQHNNKTEQQTESHRKMLLAMVDDIRVVFVKLAERTQTLRNLSNATPELKKLIAHETLSIFAPLANRLGVWQIKWELEDLSMRYLNPELYRKVAKLLDSRRVDRESYIADVILQLDHALALGKIKNTISGRPKHIYSIINKMKGKQIEFEELYDVRAVRILVDDIQDCYAALSVLHDLWPPIASEFDDYIAHPKENGYRSLHTAVTGPGTLALEVQIRTHDMHHDSELGIAAHWRYKENKKSDAVFDDKIAWLRQILAWKSELSDSGGMREAFKNELLQDRVYVFTPRGRVMDLPKGATPVDFAYILHTNLGHRTRGAKINGRIAPLTYTLQNGQRVEILTTKQGGPSRDWINPSLGFLKNPRTRAKVRAWFKNQNLEKNISLGRTQIDRALHRHGVTSINLDKLSQRLHFNKLENFLAALGRNELTQRRIAVAIQEECPTKMIDIGTPNASKLSTPSAVKADITIGGENNLMTRLGKCCCPAPGDAIVGYITRIRGITIHRENCPFMLRMTKIRPDRKLTAQWDA